FTANRRKKLEDKLPEMTTLAASTPAAENQFDEEAAAYSGDPERLLENCGDELRHAFEALNETERETLLLFSLAELSYAEIAKVTEAPEATVLTRLSRARSKLRSRLLKKSG